MCDDPHIDEIELPTAEETLGASLRTIVREELEAAFQRHRVDMSEPTVDAGRSEPAHLAEPLAGVDRFLLVPYVEHVLREAGGGPMRCADIAARVYALGFEHKWPPKNSDQLIRSINASDEKPPKITE